MMKPCPICHSSFRRTNKPWLFHCSGCGFLQSTLEPNIQNQIARETINEAKRETALKKLRIANFERILDRIETLLSPLNQELLDVGCAHGWFLELAAKRNFTVFGLEPDKDMSILAASGGQPVWHGFFPDDIPHGKQFDVIVFNDVFEHLPDVSEAMNSCRKLLKTGGILVINLPCSKGIFYQLATLLDRIGFSSPLERMWQKQFASPHLAYFTPSQLFQLAEQFGFTEVHRSSLPSFETQGLWERLRYDRTTSLFSSAIIWLSLLLLNPLLQILPSDISLQMFRLD